MEQWSARWAHNPKVAGSNHASATNREMADMQFMACPTQKAGNP